MLCFQSQLILCIITKDLNVKLGFLKLFSFKPETLRFWIPVAILKLWWAKVFWLNVTPLGLIQQIMSQSTSVCKKRDLVICCKLSKFILIEWARREAFCAYVFLYLRDKLNFNLESIYGDGLKQELPHLKFLFSWRSKNICGTVGSVGSPQ
jgi:hypothetical protein